MATDEVGEASPLDARVIEANALALGLSLDQLMENAGRAVAEEAARQLGPPGTPVAVVAGVGNNGGDGSCAAFYLAQWGYHPSVWLLRAPSEIAGAAARRCWERIQHRLPTTIGAPTAADLAKSRLIVDAALGAGQSGALRSPYREAVEAMRSAHLPILSVDVPTGLGTGLAVRPEWTVALTVRKSGMSPENSGEIRVKDIGIPAEAWQETGPGEFLLYPDPRSRAGRGRSARVLVVGGGPYVGAPVLAGLSALRSGTERVTLALPSPAAEAAQALSPDLVVRAIGHGAFAPSDSAAIRALATELHVDALVLGMGAGRAPETIACFRELIGAWRAGRPLVVDADALGALEPTPGAAGHVVATPNAGEYVRLFGPESGTSPTERLALARRRATEWGLTLLVKGEVDLITDGRATHLNRHHHPAATVGGVGDVLAGVVGGLLAQGLPTQAAARLGAYWVGVAGGMAAERRDYGLIASDVLEALPGALVQGRGAGRP